MRDAGIATAPSVTVAAHRDDPDDPALHERIEVALGLPVFVKPARLGSSVGISKAHDRAELATALALAFGHDDKVLVEQFVEGREVECGVLGNESPIASAVGEILPHNEWYDFEAKYVEGGSDIVIPAAPDGRGERPASSGRRWPPSRPATWPAWRASTSSCRPTAPSC